MTPNDSFAIAVAQTCPHAGDVAANLAEHVRHAAAAAAAGARLVLFPELSLTGYELERAAAIAFHESDRRLQPLRAVAHECSITLIVGAPVRLPAGLHIGAFVIRPEGEPLLYAKQRLGAFPAAASVDGVVPPAEDTVFVPGDRDLIVEIDGTPAALAICADTGDRSHIERARARGAAAYLASSFVIPSEFVPDSARLARYAAEHSVVVALANYGAATGGLAAAGRSSIWAQNGDLLVRLGPHGSGLAIARRTRTGWSAEPLAPVAPSTP